MEQKEAREVKQLLRDLAATYRDYNWEKVTSRSPAVVNALSELCNKTLETYIQLKDKLPTQDQKEV